MPELITPETPVVPVVVPAPVQKIGKGIGTVSGILGGLAGIAIPVVGELADASKPLGVSPAVFVIAGTVLLVATILGRAGQAIAVFLRGGQA